MKPVNSITIEEFRAMSKGKPSIRRSPPEERTDSEGITHDSKTNLKVWAELGARQKVGEIVWSARDVRFWLAGVWYKADFVFLDNQGQIHYWEVKSKNSKVRPDWRRCVRNVKQVEGLHDITVELVER